MEWHRVSTNTDHEGGTAAAGAYSTLDLDGDDPRTQLADYTTRLQIEDTVNTDHEMTMDLVEGDLGYADHRGILRFWTAGNLIFNYYPDGTLVGPLSAEEMHTFIHARGWSGVDRSLQILIQRCPASTDRFMEGQPKCLFKECPIGRVTGQENRIQEGEYMIAFDELVDYRVSTPFDPHAVSGYAHLYCAERWLDFPLICMNADLNVEAAGRYTKLELDGLSDVALDFAAQQALNRWLARVRQTFRRPYDYPSRSESSEVVLGAFEGSLTHQMHLARVAEIPACEMDDIDYDGTHIDVNLGNLEVHVTASIVKWSGESRISAPRRKLLLKALSEFDKRFEAAAEWQVTSSSVS